MTKYLGFYPEETNDTSAYFDLLEGQFITKPSLNPLITNEQVLSFKKLLGINFDALLTLKITKANRESLLKSVMLYFELHLHGFRKPKSLAVLNAVFD